MDRNIEEVVGLLIEINSAYVRMTALSEKKRDSIIRGDAQTVGEIAREEWTLLEKIDGLEKKRMEAVRKVLEEWNMPDGEITLAGMKQRAGKDMRERIEQAGDALKKTIAAQKKLNEQNRALLDLHFSYMEFMMDSLTGGDAGGRIYGNSGSIQETDAGSVSILDSHV
jgi:hypothetical protein